MFIPIPSLDQGKADPRSLNYWVFMVVIIFIMAAIVGLIYLVVSS